MKKFSTYLILLGLFLFTTVQNSFTQVTVVASGGVPFAPYANLNAAFAAINSGVHTGIIRIGISASIVEPGPAVLNGSGAGTASYQSVIMGPISDAVTISGVTTTGRGLIEFNGADSVMIEGDNPNTAGTNRNLTIQNTSPFATTFTSCVRLATSTLVTSCDLVTVRNCNLIGSGVGANIATQTTEVVSWGIIASAGASTVSNTNAPNALASATTPVPAGQTHLGLVINNNNIQTVSRGVSVNGSANTVATGLVISNNIIGNATAGAVDQVYAVGITAQGTANGIIRGNTVRVEGFIGSSTPNRAINVGMISTAGVSGMLIEKNIVERMINSNGATWTASGIDITGGANHIIQNNFVGNCLNSQTAGSGAFSTTFGAFGIRILAGAGHKIYHNTVHFTGAIPGATSTDLVTCLAIVSTASTGMDIRNNIFSNNATGGNPTLYNTVLVSVYLPAGATSAMNLTWNNNAYYCGALPQNGIAQVSTTGNAANLYLPANFIAGATAPATNFRSYTSTLSVAGTNDNASYASSNATPVISATDLHLNLASSELVNVEQKGDPAVGVLVDIDGNVRPSAATVNPDMGGDEVAVATCGAANGGTITPSTYTVCANQTVNLVSTGASTGTGITYQWQVSATPGGPYSNVVGGSGATTTSYTTGALAAGTYYYVLQTTCSAGPITGLSNQVTVTVNPNPTVGVTPASSTYCSPGGLASTLTANGASTYTWGPAAGLSATTGTSVDASPATSTTYTVTGTSALGCTATATAIVNNALNPTATATATPSAICSGANSLLVGANLFTLSYCQPTSSCTFPDIITNVTFGTINRTSVCDGAATGGYSTYNIPNPTLAAGSIYPYSISTGGDVEGAAMWIDYNQNGTFEATEQIFNGFAGTNPATYSGNATIPLTAYNGPTKMRVRCTYNANPNGLANPPCTNVTFGETEDYDVTISGGVEPVTYLWSPSTFLGATNNDTANATGVTATTTYILTVTSGNGCADTASAIVYVNPLATAATSTPASNVCENTSLTLNSNATNGGLPYTYVWSGPNAFTSGSANPVIASVTLADAGVYTVTVSDNCGSISTSTVSVVVDAAPVISVTPSSSSYCTPGPAITLTASGGLSYNWSPAAGLSATTGSSVDATPVSYTAYIVSGDGANGCFGYDTAVVNVGTYPTASATVTPAIMCSGDTATLIGMGSQSVSPYCQPTYTNGTAFGDYISSVQLDSINNNTVGAAAPYYTLYPAGSGTTTVLVAGNSYNITLSAGTFTANDLASWIDYNQNGILNDAGEKLGETDQLGASPATTTFNFTVPLTAYNGTTVLRVREMDHAGTNDMDPCTSQSTFGEVEDYYVTIVGGIDAVSYSWSPSTFLSSTTNDTVMANAVTAVTNYIFTTTTGAGCSMSDTVTVDLFAVTPILANATSTSICSGDSVLLYGTGAVSYSWNNSVVDSVSFAPVSTLSYIVTGTDINSCINMDTISVTVNALPAIGYTAIPNDTVCNGSSAALNGTGGVSYVWSGGISNGVSFTPAGSLTYTVTGTDINGCSNTNTADIVVQSLPTVGYTATANDSVCAGGSVTLSGTGASSYVWSGGIFNATSFVPAGSLTYTVTGTDAFGCTNTASAPIVVVAGPSVNLGANIVQANPPAVLDAGAGFSSYLWSTSATTQNISVNTNGQYIVTVTNAFGCTDSDTIQVNFTSGIVNYDGSTTVVSLYPNPTSNGVFNVNIQNIETSNMVIDIMDMTGRLVYNRYIGSVSGNLIEPFSLNELSMGTYVLRMTANGKATQLRFIVNK